MPLDPHIHMAIDCIVLALLTSFVLLACLAAGRAQEERKSRHPHRD